MEILSKIGETNALSKPVTSNSVSTPQVSKGVNNAKVIAPVMFRISPDRFLGKQRKCLTHLLYHEEMSILSRRKSVPGIVAVNGENGKENYSVLT
nr:hypothetical protein [Tanacetum cinerariifolium]